MKHNGRKVLAIVCSAVLVTGLVPVLSLQTIVGHMGLPGFSSDAVQAQAAPVGDGIADAEGENLSTFADLVDQQSDEGYRDSVEYVSGKVVFAVRDVRDEGAAPERISDASSLSKENGLTDVSFVYESKSKTAQVEAGKVAYDVYYEASIAGDDVWGAVDALNADGSVLYAEPDITWQNTAIGSYTEATSEETHEAWQLDAINAKSAWQKAYSVGIDPGRDVVVAVIDTGVDYDHIDLTESMWKNNNEMYDGRDDDGDGFADDVFGVNLVANTGDPMDDQGHGTHVAGIIAAQAGNGGSVGVAYGAQIMAIKAGQSTGTFASSDIARAINYAVEHGADVINMSFGGTGRSAVVEAALADAYSSCVLVAAAGNEGLPTSEALSAGYNRTEDIYPAGYSYVLGVMSCDGNGDGSLSGFSNWDYAASSGCEYEIIAPGENVYSTLPGNRYAKWSGTSMAAPEVSAAAAIIRSLNTDKSKYTSRYIMGQLASASDKSVSYTDKNGAAHSFAKLDIAASLDKVPTPELSIVDTYIFDSPSISSANNGDGIVQPGETVDLGVVVRNQWGIASNVVLTADSVSDMGVASPYISFDTNEVAMQDVGTFASADNGFVYDDGALTGVSKPIRFTVSSDATNAMQLSVNLHVRANNGMNADDKATYTADGSKTFEVQNGQTLHGVLKQDTTLTSDKLWIIDSSLLVPEGVTLTIEPGTQVQFWSSDANDPYANNKLAYIQVEGKLISNGTQDAPVNMYVDNGHEGYGICIGKVGDTNAWQAICDDDYSASYIELNYTKVENPSELYESGSNWQVAFSATVADHCEFLQDYVSERGYGASIGDKSFWYGAIRLRNASNSLMNNLTGSLTDSFAASVGLASVCLLEHSSISFNPYTHYGELTAKWQNSVFLLNGDSNRVGKMLRFNGDNVFKSNAVLNNLNDFSTLSWMPFEGRVGSGSADFSSNYWGTTDANLVQKQVTDADSDVSRVDLVQEPFLTLDSAELETIYPFVTEAYVTDLAGNKLDDVSGAQEVQMHVKFNRDMSSSVQPMVTYGPAAPYTDYAVYGDWKSAREWVGTMKIDPFIDQGTEYIRVKDAAAADDEWLKTGTDEGRFKFNVSKVNAAAMTLQGSAETDGVHLSWKQDDYDTLAGYNVYRAKAYDKEKPAEQQQFTKVNSTIVPVVRDGDSLATYGSYDDATVDPVTDYYYYFTVVDTQLNESEPSNVVKATTSAIDLSQAVISVDEQRYTGSNVCPDAVVMLNGTRLTKGTDYTVSFENNQRPGTATITIKGKGNYAGTVSAQFNIVCGHTLSSEVTTEPTCEQPGVRHYECSTCGYSYDEAIQALGHEVVEDAAVEATCTEPGKKAGSHCSRCGEVLKAQLEVPALGHGYIVKQIQSATCTEPGSVTKICVRCGNEESSAIEPLGHDVVNDEGVPPTCTASGTTGGSHCLRCGAVIEAQGVANPLGHDFVDTVTDPTCDANGYTTHVCSRCGYTYVGEYTRPVSHTFEVVDTKPATCTEDGIRTYTCTQCGFSYTETTIAVGHSWGEWMVKQMPTTQSAGLMARYCEVCDAEEDKEVAQLPGHEVGNGYADVADYKQYNGADVTASNVIVPKATDAVFGYTEEQAKDKIFAGWFTDETCKAPYTKTSGVAYAKFVDANLLTVKRQVTSSSTLETSAIGLKLLTAVDSLDYSKVGFKVSLDGGDDVNFESKAVYSRIATCVNGVVSYVEPSIFGSQAKFFMAHTLTGITQSYYPMALSVTPYWKTLDGTMVYGTNRTFKISEAIQADMDQSDSESQASVSDDSGAGVDTKE